MRLSHLYKSVCPSVGWSVGWFVGQSVKIAKSIGKSLFSACLSTYIACLSIHWSVRPLFWLSVYYSVHQSVHSYVCDHIVKIAKSSEINWNLIVQFNKMRKILKRKLYGKAVSLFVRTCSSLLKYTFFLLKEPCL